MDWVLPYLNVSNILQGIAIVGGCVSFIVYIRSELVSLRIDMNQIKKHQEILMESLKQLNTILTSLAVQDARLNMIEKDIDELRHHRGFVD